MIKNRAFLLVRHGDKLVIWPETIDLNGMLQRSDVCRLAKDGWIDDLAGVLHEGFEYSSSLVQSKYTDADKGQLDCLAATLGFKDREDLLASSIVGCRILARPSGQISVLRQVVRKGIGAAEGHMVFSFDIDDTPKKFEPSTDLVTLAESVREYLA